MFAALTILGCGSLGFWFIPADNVVMLCVSYGVMGFGSAVLPLAYSMQADIVDYAEWRHHYRAEGAVAALFSFVMKLAGAIGAAIPAFILGLTGYVANVQQTPQALRGIIHTMSTIPCAFAIIGAFVFLLYPITHTMHVEITEELSRRRSESNN